MMSSAARSAWRVTSCWETSCSWRSRASLTMRSASRLASASISWRSLTIQRACLISSGIVARIWSRIYQIYSRSIRTWSVSGAALAPCTSSSSLSMRTRTSIGLLEGTPREGFCDDRGHEVRDRPAERGELAHAARREEAVAGRRHQEDGLDLRCDSFVEVSHLQFPLEVGDGA